MSTSEPPYRFEDASGYSIIVVQPRLNDSQWSEFENVGNELLGRLHQAKTPAYLVDLSSLSYMGSAMVALIVRLWKGVKERNGKMVVINRHPMVYEVLKLAGLHNVWTIVDSREQALRQLGRSGASSDGSGMLVGLAAVGMVAGLVGLAMLFNYIPLKISNANKVAMAITAVGAVIGLSAGAVCAAKRTGSQQKVGIALAVFSAIVLIVALVGGTGTQSSPSNAPAEPKPTLGESSTTPPVTPEVTPTKRSKRKKDDDAQPADGKAADAGADTGAPAATEPAAAEPKKEEATDDKKDEKTDAAPAENTKPAPVKKSEGSSKGLGGFKGLPKKDKE